MFPSAQTLFRRCFQRRVRIRSLIIRSNSFCPPPEQLSLFPPHDSEEPQAHSTTPSIGISPGSPTYQIRHEDHSMGGVHAWLLIQMK